jgi:hypothetical protein
MNGGKFAKYGYHWEIKYFLFRLFYVIREKDEGSLIGFDIEHRLGGSRKLPEIDFYLELQLGESEKINITKNYYEVKSGKNILSKSEVIKTIKNFWKIYQKEKNSAFYICYRHKTRGYLILIPFIGHRWKNNQNILTGKEAIYRGLIEETCGKLNTEDKSFYKKINKSFFEKINLVPIDKRVNYEHLTKTILKDMFGNISVKSKDETINNFYNAIFKEIQNYIDSVIDENYNEGLDYYLIDNQPLLKMILTNKGLCQSLIIEIDNKMNYAES